MIRSREKADKHCIKLMNPTRDVLIYGFKPYLRYSVNITESIIGEINSRKIGRGFVFDVEFNRRMFTDALRRHSPRIILGLGQHPRARKIRIERRARNWQEAPDHSGSKIVKSDPEFQYVSLKLPSNEKTTITYDAGSYVCNFSMYVANEEARKMEAKYAFLHVPRNAKSNEVVSLIGSMLSKL